MAKVKAADPAALKRTAPGQYASGDGRFTVEQESAGTWVVVDTEQTNELGLPLVRGPFATLNAAREAVGTARHAAPPPSPLEERLNRARTAARAARPTDRTRPRRGERPPAPRPLLARPASPADAGSIVRIYNAGIEAREATFETEARSRGDILGWLDGRHPVVVVTRGDDVVAFAATFEYRARTAYAGVAEFSVYADPGHRREGAGRMAMEALIEAATEGGFWKLVSRVFPENEASLGLLRSVGFREVGVYRHHARLDGEWRDCVIVERLLGEARED
jgi:L-amino acid N-acyltransferase YncA